MTDDEMLKMCFDKLVEVSKARMTIGLALALATVTLTGYALQSERAEVFLVAAAVPVLSFLADHLAKAKYGLPLFYKALSYELGKKDSEAVTLMFLSFGEEPDRYLGVFQIKSHRDRQRKFRSLYLKRHLGLKIIIFCAVIAGEVLLYCRAGA